MIVKGTSKKTGALNEWGSSKLSPLPPKTAARRHQPIGQAQTLVEVLSKDHQRGLKGE